MKKVIWVNPSFLDYRISVYKELNEIFDGNFFIYYSKNRVPSRIIWKIQEVLGDNAIGFENEKTIQRNGSGFSNQGFTIPYQKDLLSRIYEKEPDVLITEGFFQWTPYALVASLRLKIPIWISYERTIFTERNCPKWRTLYRKLIDSWVTGYLVNGSLTQKYLTNKLNVESKPIIRGCMSADSLNIGKKVQSYNTKLNRSELKSSRDRNAINFLFVGQIIDRKGVLELIEAWRLHEKLYPNDKLLIIGEGNLKKELIEKISGIKSIKYLGVIEYDEIYKYYAVCDVFILPTKEDNWSLVIPEAMASKLPIATTIYNGCYPELVQENRNGKLFDSLDCNSILETLKYFHGKNLVQMGEESYEIEKEYSPKLVAKRIHSAIEKSNYSYEE